MYAPRLAVVGLVVRRTPFHATALELRRAVVRRIPGHENQADRHYRDRGKYLKEAGQDQRNN